MDYIEGAGATVNISLVDPDVNTLNGYVISHGSGAPVSTPAGPGIYCDDDTGKYYFWNENTSAWDLVADNTSINGVTILTGAADPSAGGGVAATRPALYIRTGTDQVYLKTGAGNSNWSLLPTGLATATPTTIASGAGTVGTGSLAALSNHAHPAALFTAAVEGLVGAMTFLGIDRSANLSGDTAFRPSATRPTHAVYTVRISCAAGEVGRIQLLSDAANPPTTPIGGARNAGLVGLTNVVDTTLVAFIQPGHYVKLHAISDTGAPVFSLQTTAENVL